MAQEGVFGRIASNVATKVLFNSSRLLVTLLIAVLLIGMQAGGVVAAGEAATATAEMDATGLTADSPSQLESGDLGMYNLSSGDCLDCNTSTDGGNTYDTGPSGP
jgi:hypothetical protein